MNDKLFYFTLLGAALVIGFAFGRVLAKVTRSRLGRISWRILGLAGTILVFVSVVCADGDRRFRILGVIGIFLQIVGLAASFTREQKA